MLIEFTFQNFLSFKNPTTLSLEKGKYLKKYADTHVMTKQNISLLKNVNIFGANGGGKSNIITALKVFSKLVTEPTGDIEDLLPYMPFKLDDLSTEAPTEFSVYFIKESNKYRYTLHYDAGKIHLEELSIVSDDGDQETVYFRRSEVSEVEEILPEHLRAIRDSVRPNKLLLFDAQDKNDKQCIQVFQWFHSNLVFELTDKKLFHLLKRPKEKALFLKFLNLADFNIVDIEVIEKNVPFPEEFERLLESIPMEKRPVSLSRSEVFSVYKKFNHKGQCVGKERISFDMESEGTKKMMLLALNIINSLNKERILLMDEFDDSFHLSLAKAVLNVINSCNNFNQFIFTSHNLNLLDHRQRVDQIYMVEKDFTGCTELFSLFDFNEQQGMPRQDIGFLKRYLNGKFGALPDIDTEGITQLFEEVNKCPEEEKEGLES